MTLNPVPDQIRGVLLDLSGTLHIGNTPIDGTTVDAIRRLKACNRYKIRYVSNTTKQSTPDLVANLQRMGFPIQEEEVFTSLTATKALLQSMHVQRPMLFLEPEAAHYVFNGTEQGDSRQVEGEQDDHDAVVVGLCPDMFHYEKLSEAMRVLMEGGKLIAIHRGRYYAREGKPLGMGPGAFVSALEYAAGKQADALVGKPNPGFFHLALADLQLLPSECIMVGDDVRDDVEGALDCGLAGGWLVQTGKYQPGDELKVPGTCVFSNLTQVVDTLLRA